MVFSHNLKILYLIVRKELIKLIIIVLTFQYNFLASGLNIIESISKHDPDFQLFVLSLDEKNFSSLKNKNSKM